MTGQFRRDPTKGNHRAFNAKRLNASEAEPVPLAGPVVRRCACGALACYGWGLGETVWYCAACVPAGFWDNKRRAEGEAIAPAPRPAGPTRSRRVPHPKQGSLEL